eukprot:6443358-Ditylum_brightwellii.AAC.1
MEVQCPQYGGCRANRGSQIHAEFSIGILQVYLDTNRLDNTLLHVVNDLDDESSNSSVSSISEEEEEDEEEKEEEESKEAEKKKKK